MSMRTALVREALRWPGQDFHPGISCQCAAFVAACLDAIGYQAPAWQAFPNKNWVPDYQSLGVPVASAADLRAGDLIIFARTYVPMSSTHIGIYVGDGDFVHRPTASEPVARASLTTGYWQDHFQEGRRLFPLDVPAAPTATGNDGQVQAGAPTRRVRLYAHDGLASLVIDSETLPLKTLTCTLTVGPDDAEQTLSLLVSYPTPSGPDGLFKLFHHDTVVNVVIDGIEQAVLDFRIETHIQAGKPAGILVAVEVTPVAPVPLQGKAFIGQLLDQAAAQDGIPPDILKAVAWQESGWDPNALSYDGQHGKGVMQIDDRYHAFATTPAVFDPAQNIAYGAHYLKQLFDQEGTWSAALTDYNGSSAYARGVLALAQSRPWITAVAS
jgi:hypothetical protein